MPGQLVNQIADVMQSASEQPKADESKNVSDNKADTKSEADALAKESSNDTEVTLLGPTVLKDILRDTGLDEAKVNSVDAVYRHTCGDSIITAANVVEHKNTVQAPGIKIDISSGFSDKLRTSVVDGRRCILIDLDDPTVEVNGLPITLQ
jgi:mannitol-specific phosphotransferase system IIBC component